MVVDEMTDGSSVLFVQGTSKREGAFRAALRQTNGKLYDLQLSDQGVVDVKNLAATHDYYHGGAN